MKDADFVRRLERYGKPPQLIWLTSRKYVERAVVRDPRARASKVQAIIAAGEPLAEIADVGRAT